MLSSFFRTMSIFKPCFQILTIQLEIRCTAEFKKQFDKLCKNKSYRHLEKNFIEGVLNSDMNTLCVGTTLAIRENFRLIKERLGRSRDFRMYYLAYPSVDIIHMLYLHPKTGSMGMDNISSSFRDELLASVEMDIRLDSYFNMEAQFNKLRFHWQGP